MELGFATAQHGSAIDSQHNIRWSRWSRLETSLDAMLVPDKPGVFALAEEVISPAAMLHARTAPAKTLAVFEVGTAEDLSVAIARLFGPLSPWRERMAAARCHVRYAVIEDESARAAAVDALRRWLNSSA